MLQSSVAEIVTTVLFARNETSGHQGQLQCRNLEVKHARAIRLLPKCYFQALDMGYSAAEGLITDMNSALVALVCSSQINITQVYFTVNGPDNATVQVEELVNHNTTLLYSPQIYLISSKWEEVYSGRIAIELIDDAVESDATLVSSENSELLMCHCDDSHEYTRIRPIQFTVKPPGSVLVKSVAHRISTGC